VVRSNGDGKFLPVGNAFLGIKRGIMAVKTERKYCRNLYEVAAVVNSARTIDTVLHSVVESVSMEVRAKGCSAMLLTPDKKRLHHTATYGLSTQYIKKGSIAADKSIAEALTGKPVAVYAATEDKRIQYREQAGKEGIASILTVPMSLKGEIIGVMRVYTSEPRHFTDDDIYFISIAANIGAIALENAVLSKAKSYEFEAFRQQLQELEWARWRA
jgi:signal transduction protein with GAF and PtsI domain